MSEHRAIIRWKNNAGADFLKRKYSREHSWSFDGGATVPASSSPHVVPVPLSNPACVDPEEAFIASVASCHMLWFLHLAGEAGFSVESYVDEAVGLMAKNSTGAFWISEITLRPQIVYRDGNVPSTAKAEELHHKSHEQCFIANSIRTKVTVVAAS
jgi:organic hydroperoxide reductase OsmC/OhrA